MANSEWIFEVGDQDFQAKVLDKSKEVPVVVDFWAPWCGPCRMLGPVLEKLIEERQGQVLLAKVNTDEAQRLAMDFGIQSIPTVIAFRHGRPVLDFMGVLPEAQLRRFLDDISPTEAEKETREASQLEKSNAAEAEMMYRDALAKDHNQEDAILGLARILINKGETEEALQLIENVGSGGAAGEEAEKLRAQVWLQQATKDLPDESKSLSRVIAEPKNSQVLYELGCVLAHNGKYEDALKSLLAAGELDPKLATTKVREAMVKVFALVGQQSSLANDYRSKLSALLY